MTKPVASPRRRLQDSQAQLDQQFRQGAEVSALLRARASLFDSALTELFNTQPWPKTGDQGNLPLALLAVGGYGRGELHPFSDIDILILLAEPPDAELKGVLEAFLHSLWDLGTTIGHSVRTLSECVEEARQDVSVMTNLLETRTLVGAQRLRLQLGERLSQAKLWPGATFFNAKLEEQNERHRRYDNTEYNLEPNVKNGPGGLRDIQMLGWVARHHYGTNDFEHLISLGFLTADELLALLQGRDFLWKVRWGLHLLAKRAEEQLRFDNQRQLAALFGYEDSGGQLAVERFMHDYYVHVLALRELNDLILQHFDEAIVSPAAAEPREIINEDFEVQGRTLAARREDVFKARPRALLELFVILANRKDIDRVRASTIRMIRKSLDLIDDAFRANPENCACFMALLRSPHRLVSQLTRMRRYGVLGRYLPEFGRIIGQMQHDLFHIYTVDAHTMLLLRNLRRFLYDSAQERYPVAQECMRQIPKPELLYIAGLYHDIAKGRGGDHSTLGAEDVERFAQRHGLESADRELVSWLVRQHLLMSDVAQRKDISDPEVLAAFTGEVKTEERLRYLYALTVADINATNPSLWNSWRATLMRQLFEETRQLLASHGAAIPDREDWIASTRQAALDALAARGIKAEAVVAFFSETDEDYFLRLEVEDIVWQLEAALSHNLEADGPLVRVRTYTQAGGAHEGATQVFIFAHDQANLFAATAAILDQQDLSVHEARVHTTGRAECYNSFMVLTDAGTPLTNEDAQRHLEATLRAVLAEPNAFPDVVRRRIPRALRAFQTPTEVYVENDPRTPVTDLRVVANDRPGLLARLGLIFLEEGISLQGAKIATLGERIDDIFYITGEDREPITDPATLTRLQDTIRQRLDEAFDQAPGHHARHS